MAIGALTGVATVAVIKGDSAKRTIQDSIEKQTNILIQLRLTYSKLDEWRDLSREYVDLDINSMNNNRMTLIEKFVRVRLQCKCLGEIFDRV